MNTIKRKPNENVSVSSLLKQIIEGANCSDDNKPCPKAIKHGQAMKPAAKQHYIRMMKGNHTNFHAQDCGIFIHPQHSYIGDSPDMLISCSCCGDGLLEVKCPIIAPCNVCLPNICKCQGKCLKYLQYVHVDGCASLKKNTAYYAQVQGHMAVTNRSNCDFFIYTSYATFCERICFDFEYWLDIVSNLDYFFKKYLASYLLFDEVQLDVLDYHEHQPMKLEEGSVCFCRVCNQVVKEQDGISSFREGSIACDNCESWYHFKCIKMTKSALQNTDRWLCTYCS